MEGGGQLRLCLLLLSAQLVAGDQLEGVASLSEDARYGGEPSPLSQHPALGSLAYHEVKVKGFLEGSLQPV